MKEKTPFSSHAVESGALTLEHYIFHRALFIHLLNVNAPRTALMFPFVGIFLIIKCFLKPFELTFGLKLESRRGWMAKKSTGLLKPFHCWNFQTVTFQCNLFSDKGFLFDFIAQENL